MNQNILLTIIVPIYNMEKYLPDCLSSIQRQNFNNDVEVLLIDDGSTDNSLYICKEIAKKYSYYNVIHQENQGVSSARNTGLAVAKGKYVAWIDPDDYIMDDWYCTIKKELEDSPDMLFFDMYIHSKKVTEKHFCMESRKISKNELFEELALGNKIESHLWSKIIRRSFFDVKFPIDYSYCEDYSILHRVCFRVESCKYIHKSLYVYRQLNNSITHNKDNNLFNRNLGIKLAKKRYKFYKDNNINVSKVGIYLAMIRFCIDYYKADSNIRKRYIKVNKICNSTIKRKAYDIMMHRKVSVGFKIKILLFMLIGEWYYGIRKHILRKNY